ncbi:MAG: pro-sigmaK processing inhibitor BofA family protein [Clostridia bacterium]|nr:pro-sigmaK processing inhibitor BofA family protein [Clostridia bacterium]
MINNKFIGAYSIGLILLFLVLRVFYTPLKVVFKLCVNTLAGGFILILINFIGKFVGINIGMNVLTSLVVGILGIPGVSLMLILQTVVS